MIRKTLTAAALLAILPFAPQGMAQSVSQEEVEARYDRALAAGYKALFICSAMTNAERAGTRRTMDSIERWELTGIQAPLDSIAPNMKAIPVRVQPLGTDGKPAGPSPLVAIIVEWAEGSPPRIAQHVPGNGCRLLPPGTDVRERPTVEPAAVFERQTGIQFEEKIQEQLARTAFDSKYGEGARTTAALIMRNAKPVSEAYVDGFDAQTPQRTWSVAKSIAATVVDAAVQRGEADVEASAGLGESEADPRRAITIDNLLRMASGRYQDTPGNRTDALYFGGSTVKETALHWPLAYTPGTVFRYANNDTLAAVMAMDETFDAHPPAELFAKLGMNATVAETDW